jgi:glycerol-3-phosphate acyltransferase PlsY
MIHSKDIVAVFLSYAIGCVCVGYYLTRLCTGQDIRTSGSGSTGARNVGRKLGKTGFALTFAGDVAKGALAMWIVSMLRVDPWAAILSLLAVVAGHIWPVQLSFRGGKGIAVTLGGLLVFDYWIAAGCCLIFALCLVSLRRYIISGLIAVVAMPVMAILAGHSAFDVLGSALLAVVILFAHRANVKGIVHTHSS